MLYHVFFIALSLTVLSWTKASAKCKCKCLPYNLSPLDSHEVFNIDVLVALLRQENAQDICVIRVPSELMYTEYFVVVSGSSTRHLRAMAFYAVKVVRSFYCLCLINELRSVIRRFK